MILGGFQPLTLTDFPGRVACIVFTQGCNLRCGYCHNPQLIVRQTAEGANAPSEENVFAFLDKRRNTLDGVVVSGGEPTIQPDLLDFLAHIKALGLLVKLDTNGTNPHILREALERGLLDYVAMDIKHDPARYAEITGVAIDPGILTASRDLLLSSGIVHEFRTTVLQRFHDDAAIETIARFCVGSPRLVLQSFRPTGTANPAISAYSAPTVEYVRHLQQIAERLVGKVEVLGNGMSCYSDLAASHLPI